MASENEKNSMKSEDLQDQMQKMRNAKEKLKKKPSSKSRKKTRKKISKAAKAKGKALKAQGKAKQAIGKTKTSTGAAKLSGGGTLMGTGAALKAAGAGIALIPYCGGVGEAIMSAGDAAINKGQEFVYNGVENLKEGQKYIIEGKRLYKRGEKLEQTGVDPGGTDNENIQRGPAPSASKSPRGFNNDQVKILKNVYKLKLIKYGCILFGFIFLWLAIIGFMTDRGKEDEGNNANVPYVVSSTIMNNITIVSDGEGGFTYAFEDEEGNIISFDQAVANALEILMENGSSSLSELGGTYEIQTKTLKKMLLAEIRTQYPDLSNSGLTEGTANSSNSNNIAGNVSEVLASMTLDEKIYQLLMVGVQLSNGQDYAGSLAGGFILHGGSNYDANLGSIGSTSKVKPFIATDDEGGQIVRAAVGYPSAQSYGNSQDYEKLYNDEVQKTKLLLSKGINVNLGPDADVASSGTMYESERSYSSDYNITKQCVKTVIEARNSTNLYGVSISSSLKHYPGYGSNGTNSDWGSVTDNRSVEEINKDIEVFKEGINAGAESVMVSHIVYTNLDANNTASLSPTIISELRKNFSGVIMTDDIDATATSSISDRYKRAIIAGNDMILLGVNNIETAYNQIKSAVQSGEITEERINASVTRILQMKKNAGLIEEFSTITDTQSQDDEENVQSQESQDSEENGETESTEDESNKSEEAEENENKEDDGTTSINTSTGTVISEEIKGGVQIQRKDSNGNVKLLKYIDEATFNQLVTDGTDDVMNYYTLKKTSKSTSLGTMYAGGSDVLNDWVASWEDQVLFLYRSGKMSYNSGFISRVITEDGKYYICRTDEGTGNGTLNYGYGVCVYNPRESSPWMHIESFKKYGIDITQSVLNETQIEVEIVDKVKMEELQSHKEYIIKQLSEANITLNDEQVNALTAIAYQFGDSGANIPLFISLYKQYGNSEELKERYSTSGGGTYFFKQVPGGTNPEGMDRADANWALFHDGIYYAGTGGSLSKVSYSGTSGNTNLLNSLGTSSNVDNGDFSGGDNQQIAWNFFKSMGLSDVCTAAIVGNLMTESYTDIRPTADNGSHRGIAQWDYNDRYANLKNYAASINKNPDDLQTQLKFLWLELDPSADHTYATSQLSQEKFNQFITFTDIDTAAKYFADHFERCAGQAITERQKYANEVYAKFVGTGGPVVTSLDNFLFVGDSRYSTVSGQISNLAANIKNQGVGSATVKEWLTVAKNRRNWNCSRKIC